MSGARYGVLVLCIAACAAHAQSHDHAMPMPAMQGGSAVDDARDPDAYADGLRMGPMSGMDMRDDAWRGHLLVDRLEQFEGRRSRGQSLDAQAWYGADFDRLWLKIDGDREDGRLGATRTEALWDHAIAPYWSAQAGVRHDLGRGPVRRWAALGVQGLAPYWFDVESTLYVGAGGRTALRVEAEYDLRITRRVVLQPNVEVEVYGKDDPRRAIGAGLSKIDTGLRLRYEVSRRFAPYLGVVFTNRVGNTRREAKRTGEPASDARGVAGIRVRF